MTPNELRTRLESHFGPVHTADRAAAALGVHKSAVFRWLAGDRPVPLYVVRHLETIETVSNLAKLNGLDPNSLLPAIWLPANCRTPF